MVNCVKTEGSSAKILVHVIPPTAMILVKLSGYLLQLGREFDDVNMLSNDPSICEKSAAQTI